MNAAVEVVGDWGQYQKRTFALLCMQFFCTGMLLYSMVYSLVEPKHRCKIQDDDVIYDLSGLQNSTVKASILLDKYGDYIPCNYCSNRTTTELVPCNGFVYDLSEIKRSLVNQFDLVCSRRFMAATIATASLLGRCIGSVLSGFLADRYGRKTTLVWLTVVQVLCTLLSIAPDPYVFLFCRLVSTGCSSGAWDCAYIIVMEIVSPSRRILLSAFSSLVFTIGYFSVTAAMYVLRDWQYLTMFLLLPLILLPFIVKRWIPESPLWLLSTGKCDAAKKVLCEMAACNNKQLSDSDFVSLLDDQRLKQQEVPNLKSFVKSRVLCRRVLIFFIMCSPASLTKCQLLTSSPPRLLQCKKQVCYVFRIAVNMAYYGLPLQFSYLFGGTYVNHALNALVEIPVFFMLYVSACLGRKKTALICLGTGSAGLFTVGILQYLGNTNGVGYVSLMASVSGKFGAASAYNELYIWTVETMPTKYRNMVLGLCSSVSGIGSAVAPFLIQMDTEKSHTNQGLPSMLFGGVLLLSCLATVTIPETNGKLLPDNIVEAEQLGESKRLGYTQLP